MKGEREVVAMQGVLGVGGRIGETRVPWNALERSK